MLIVSYPYKDKKEVNDMKKIIVVFCLMMVVGTTVVPKPCEEHHTLDYCWLEEKEVKGSDNGVK